MKTLHPHIRGLLLIALLSISGFAWSAQSEPLSDVAKKTTVSNTGKNASEKELPKPAIEPKTAHSEVAKPEEKAEKSWLDKFFEDPIATFTGLLFFATGLLWWSTRGLVKGRERIAEKQLRAYVHGSIGRCVWKFSKSQNAFTDLEINMKWENFGVTPALDCVFWNVVSVQPLDDEIPLFKNKKPKEADNFMVTLSPKGSLASRPINVSIKELAGVFDKRVKIVLYGIIEYKDVFSSRRNPTRFTEICYEVTVESDPRLFPNIEGSMPPEIVGFHGTQNNNSST